jgi:SAM-dependent methyltransferase
MAVRKNINAMVKLRDKLDKLWFPDTLDNWDDIILRNCILTILEPHMHILDLGAGCGIVEQMNFRGKCARVCGVDLDPRVLENPWLDDARVSDAGEIPYENNCFDIVLADNVMEHLVQPENVLNEINRVLRPGGHLLFKTPNRWHYMPLIARLTPHWFHQYFNQIRGRDPKDTFPTLYRLNSRKQIRQLADRTGFEIDSITLLEGRPEYLRFTALTYFFGMLYQRIVTYVPGLSGLRILVIAHLRKGK